LGSIKILKSSIIKIVRLYQEIPILETNERGEERRGERWEE
jgi:hypothetical protein